MWGAEVLSSAEETLLECLLHWQIFTPLLVTVEEHLMGGFGGDFAVKWNVCAIVVLLGKKRGLLLCWPCLSQAVPFWKCSCYSTLRSNLNIWELIAAQSNGGTYTLARNPKSFLFVWFRCVSIVLWSSTYSRMQQPDFSLGSSCT